MKSKVIEFLQNLPEAPHEQFNKAFELYRASEGKNLGAERLMNATGYSPNGLQNLLYDLQKLHGISDVEKTRVIQLVPNVEAKVPETEEEAKARKEAEAEAKAIADANPGADISETEEEAKAGEEAEAEAKGIADANPGADISETEEEAKAGEEAEAEAKAIADANSGAEVSETEEEEKVLSASTETALRVEFPFLGDKNCPDELKILVADKITAWKLFLETQERIKNFDEKIYGADELSKLSKIAIEAFNENQKIYDELNVYATTGTILGVHPIFKKLQLLREVETMTADELIKYKNSSSKYFSVNKTALAKSEKEKDTEKVTEIKNRVAERKDKLFLVNKKLGI